MNPLLLHKEVKLITLAGVMIVKPLIPGKIESKLPHCIIWDTKVWLLLERMSATYHETQPHLLKEVH